MDNNNVVSEWSETPAMFLTSVLCEIKYKHREDYAYRENSMSQETNENASSMLFECVCTLGKYISVGLNQKKLNAKHMAAEKMLRRLQSENLLGRIKIPQTEFIDKDEALGDNPVSKLYELIQMKGLDRPYFDDEEFGNLYEMRCMLPKLKLETSARNSSKKLAKREACKLMLELVEKSDLSQCDISQEISSDYEDMSKFTLNKKNMHSYIGVQNRAGTTINMGLDTLARLQSTSNFIEVLDEFSEISGFTYDFLIIKEKSLINLHQVLARLNTFPVICVPGVGRTVVDAKNAAALQAIESINVLASRRMAFQEKTHDFRKKVDE